MRALGYRLTAWLLALLVAVSAGPAAAQQPAGRHLAIALLPETDTPAAGTTVTLALRSTPAPGWHAYWRNGGDAGVETTLAWTLPAGLRAGALRYPVPGRLLVSGLMNYVYEGPFAQLVDLTLPAGLAVGTRLPVRVKADYLVCTREICVPESQMLQTVLTVGNGRAAPERRADFDRWRQALPRPLGSPATYQLAGARFRMAVPFPAAASAKDVYFYPLGGGAIDYAATQRTARDGDALLVETAAAAMSAGGRIEGVLATGDGRGFAVAASPGAVPAIADEGGADGGWLTATLLALAGAVLGGLILNVMPCVFPILSLKALSLAKANVAARQARGEALAYAAGVIGVCLMLGAALLGLRAAGATVGWAFQLQDPRVILVLLLLVSGIALNLAGLFDLPTPAFAGRFAGRGGTAGAFATGALAAFVATPCTGPFMGAALGAALVLPPAAALLVFAGLGLGIALPFLLIGFVPALRRRLPRPGPWMERLRRLLSVPMFLTALALAWVLGRQAGVDGMTLGLAAALGVGLALWWAGRRQAAGLGAGAPVLAALLVTVTTTALVHAAPAARQAVAGAEPFSEARLAALRAQGRPVFAYFTADWCLTCKVNEKTAIETARVADAFRAGGVTMLVGDWTDGDPALGRFIEQHNRAGVPLYLWYPSHGEGEVLPQVLSTGMLAALPRRAA